MNVVLQNGNHFATVVDIDEKLLQNGIRIIPATFGQPIYGNVPIMVTIGEANGTMEVPGYGTLTVYFVEPTPTF